jgi:hypothetical protein
MLRHIEFFSFCSCLVLHFYLFTNFHLTMFWANSLTLFHTGDRLAGISLEQQFVPSNLSGYLFLVAWRNVAALLEIYPIGPILDRWSNFLFGMLYSVTRAFHHLSIPSNNLWLNLIVLFQGYNYWLTRVDMLKLILWLWFIYDTLGLVEIGFICV